MKEQNKYDTDRIKLIQLILQVKPKGIAIEIEELKNITDEKE